MIILLLFAFELSSPLFPAEDPQLETVEMDFDEMEEDEEAYLACFEFNSSEQIEFEEDTRVFILIDSHFAQTHFSDLSSPPPELG